MKKNRRKKNIQPKVFVISGPGGAGKTTLVDKLFCKKTLRNNFIKGISFTTRKRRPQEKEGRDYFFVSKEEFLRLEKRRFFLENQKVLENYYGTPKFFYKQAKSDWAFFSLPKKFFQHLISLAIYCFFKTGL